MTNGGFLLKLYSIVSVTKDIVSVLLPALEMLINRDLNRDGVVGPRKNEQGNV